MLKHNSEEDYLEGILRLQEKNGRVRSTDIAHELGVTKPTVCGAMKRLRKKDLIFFGDKGYVFLTDEGKENAKKISRKHTVLTKALKGIGVDEVNAEKEACGIGQVISDETFECLNVFFMSHLGDAVFE